MTSVLHPRHGIHAPTSGTPERTPGSVRRTATMDMLRPEGLLGPLVLTGRARDLGTGLDGVAAVLATSECTARIDFTGGRVLTEISTTPGRPALQALLGQRVSSGFRSAVTAADPCLSDEDGLLNLLLDDFPVATLVSGHAIGAGPGRARTAPCCRCHWPSRPASRGPNGLGSPGTCAPDSPTGAPS